MEEITHLSECARDYSLALRAAKSVDDLKALTLDYREIAWDAYAVVWHAGPGQGPLSQAQFEDFQAGLGKETKDKYAGDAWHELYADIVLPRLLFVVAMHAAEFKAPWGTAFLRALEAGLLERVEDRFVWKGYAKRP